MVNYKEKIIIYNYKTKFAELLELLNLYDDPRLHNYSEKIVLSSDKSILKQMKVFERRLEENYQKIFKIMVKDMSLLFKAQILLRHAYRQRHPSCEDISIEILNKVPLCFDNRNELPNQEFQVNEFELNVEKTRVFELDRVIGGLETGELTKEDASIGHNDVDLEKEKTRIFHLEKTLGLGIKVNDGLLDIDFSENDKEESKEDK